MADDSGRLNDVLAETSFLFGGNAEFVEALQAKWAADPSSVEPSWAAFFTTLSDSAESVKRLAEPPAWAPEDDAPPRPDWLSAIDGVWPAVSARLEEPDPRNDPLGAAGRGPRPHPRFPARDHDDPRLPDARPPEGQARSARSRNHRRRRHGTRPRDLRIRRERFRSPDLPRLRARPRERDDPGNPRAAQAHLLRHGRRAVHAHHQPLGKGVASAAHRGARQGDQLHPGRQDRHPEEAHRGRGLRTVPRQALPGRQALRPRRRGGGGAGPRTDHQARRRARREGHRRRHAPPRASQRPRGGDGQALPGDLPRVPGRLVAAVGHRGIGRREVPPRRLVRPDLRRQSGPPLADRQPQPPRDRQSGGAGQGAGQAGFRPP